ncbi:hypothetical protein GCM10018954_058360 [Kutzneria kofuensis]
MCGRYASAKDPAQLAVEFDALDATGTERPGADYNVAPTKPVLAIVARHPVTRRGRPDPDSVERTIRVMRWGLVPTWSQDRNVGVKMINARSETAAVKPAYRDSMARRRCILPADGWFEWKRDGGAKEPYYVTNPDDSSLAMAGLWTAWRDPDQPESPVAGDVCRVDHRRVRAVGRDPRADAPRAAAVVVRAVARPRQGQRRRGRPASAVGGDRVAVSSCGPCRPP